MMWSVRGYDGMKNLVAAQKVKVRSVANRLHIIFVQSVRILMSPVL